MRGVGGPLLCIGDLLSDVGDADAAGEAVAKSSSSLADLNDNARSADDLNQSLEIDQIFESSWTLPKHRSQSNSLERHNENSCAKKMDFQRALTEDEMCCLSLPNLERVNSSDKNRREDGKNMDAENCAQERKRQEDEASLLKEDEIKDGEGSPPSDLQSQNVLPTQASQSLPLDGDKDATGDDSQYAQVDISSYFETDKEFHTKEEIVHWAKLQGRKIGTVLVIGKSQASYRGRAPRLYLTCERGGKYERRRVPPKGLRKPGTKKCACPFELGTTWSRVGEKEWKIKLYVRNGIHNHEPVKFKGGHSSAGKLTKEEFDIVADLTKAGVKPKDIIEALRKNDPENCTTVQQLYNAVSAIKSKIMCGKSYKQHMPKTLNHNMFVDYNLNLDDGMDVGDGKGKKMDFETTLPNDEIEEDECILLKEQQSKTTQILQSYQRGSECMDNVDGDNCFLDTQMEDEVISTNVEQVGTKSRTSQTAQVSQSFPKGGGDVENCVLDTTMEDGSVDCSNQFKTDKEFRTKEEVLDWAKLQGQKTGTSIMISKSQAPYRRRAPRLYLKCDRGGDRRGTPQLRKRETKKCACPFELGTTWSRVGEEEWKIKVFVRNGFHNHPLEKFKEEMGKLTKEELDIIAVLAKAGVKPSEIMNALRKNDPGNCTSFKQLYNAIRAIKSKGPLENYKQLNQALSETGHSWTALTLKLCTALETADKLIQSANSDAKALPEKVEKLQNIMRRGDAAVKSIKLVNSSKP